MTTISKVDTSNIFTIAQQGDSKILEAHQNAIILVGRTQVGKSTTFNWLKKFPMVGKGKYNAFYVPMIANNIDGAKVGNGGSSETLAPNIYRDFQHNLSLVDMAGYGDTRNYVGVIGVSYFLKALFQKVRRVKFVIVFDEDKLRQPACTGLIKTFQGFINMFNFQLMTPPIKQKLKQSMSLIITKAERAEEHYGLISQMLEKMQDQTFLFENKPLVVELLEYLRDQARYEPFFKAKNSQQAPECTFIERFNKLGWQFFDLDQNQKEASDSLIFLPFTNDFEKLPPNEKQTFQKELNQKVENYLSYAQILKKLIENLSGNWIQFLDNWRSGSKSNLSHYKMTQLFDQVREFVRKNDLYNLNEIVTVELKVNYQPPNLIEAINSILKLQKIVQTAGEMQDFETIKRTFVDPVSNETIEQENTVSLTFKDVMEKFKGYFAEMVKIIKIFASSQEEDLLLQKTNFILKQGFRQFQMLYELDKQLVHDIKIKLTGNCNSVFQSNLKIPWQLDFTQTFVKKMDEALMTKIFPNIQALKEYENFFNAYTEKRIKVAQQLPNQQQKQEQNKCKIFFGQHRNSIETAKADLLLGLSQKEKACICYCNALKNINQLYICVDSSPLYDQQTKAEELDRLQMRKVKLIRKIVSALKYFEGENDKYKKYALELARHHNLIQDTCKIYEQLIENASNNEKTRLYQDYADYCLEWGRIDDANKALQRKLALQEESRRKYRQTIIRLKDIQTNKASYSSKYLQNLRQMERLNAKDDNLDTTKLEQIKGEVENLIKIQESKKELAKQ